jgi:hypothetical protein
VLHQLGRKALAVMIVFSLTRTLKRPASVDFTLPKYSFSFPSILMVNNIHVHWCAGLLYTAMPHVKILGFGMYSQTKMVVDDVSHPWCTLIQSYVVLTSLVWWAIIFFLKNLFMLILSMPCIFFTLVNTLTTMLMR